MQPRQPKKQLKYIQPQNNRHFQSNSSDDFENVQKYNNLIMNMPTNDKTTKANKNINQYPKNNQQQSLKHQAKHCRSLVDLNNSEVSSFMGNDKEHRQLSVDQFENKQNPHYSSVGIERNSPNEKYQSYRGTKYKNISGVNHTSIQNITKKYFGNKNHSTAQNNSSSKFNTISNSKTNKILTNRQKKQNYMYGKPHQYQYNIQELQIKNAHSEKFLMKEGSAQTTNKKTSSSIKEEDNYNLLLKLKSYIEELKFTQEGHLSDIAKLEKKVDQLTNNNQELRMQMEEAITSVNQVKKQNQFLRDQLEVMKIRQAQLIKKIKKYKDDTGHKPTRNHAKCEQHELIIQSLKNVINEQLTKIIELQKYKVIGENLQCSSRRSKSVGDTGHDKEECSQNDDSLSELEDQYFVDSIKMRNAQYGSDSKQKQPSQVEMYSFKKKIHNSIFNNESSNEDPPNTNQSRKINPYTNRLGESSINSNRGHPGKQSQYNSGESNPDSLENIPEPYYQLLLQMREKQRNNKREKLAELSMKNRGFRSISSHQENVFIDKRQKQGYRQKVEATDLQELESISAENSFSTEKSNDDQILAEVGNYLEQIKRKKGGEKESHGKYFNNRNKPKNI